MESVYLAYFMRAVDRVSDKLVLQGITHETSYRNDIYFHFLITQELKDFVDTKTPDFIVKFLLDNLRSYFVANNLNHEAFFDDLENDNFLDTTGQDIEFLKGYLDYEELPNG